MDDLVTTPLCRAVIGCGIEVHRAIGPGVFESVYDDCLASEFTFRGLAFERQVRVPLIYRDVKLDCSFRVDFVVEGSLLVELKTVPHLLPVHVTQVQTYLRLLTLRQGLLINFNVSRLVDGVKSVLNPHMRESVAPGEIAVKPIEDVNV